MNRKHYLPEGSQKRIQDAILMSGMTLTEISNKSGIARSSLYYYAYNGVNPNVSALYKLCATLHVSADWLLFGDAYKFKERK